MFNYSCRMFNFPPREANFIYNFALVFLTSKFYKDFLQTYEFQKGVYLSLSLMDRTTDSALTSLFINQMPFRESNGWRIP